MQEGQVPWPDVGGLPIIGVIIIDRVGGDPLHAAESGIGFQNGFRSARDIGMRQRRGRSSILGDRLDHRIIAIASRRIGRYGHDPGIQAAEESGDKIEPRRVEQQGTLPAKPRACSRAAIARAF